MLEKTEKLGAMARTWVRVRQVLRDSLTHFYSENSLTVSASIAYYSLLSAFPLLLLMLYLGAILIRQYEFAGQLPLVLERYLPVPPDFIMRNLVNISRDYGPVSLLSFVLLLWSSSGMFLPLERSLNRAWDVEQGRTWWRSRVLALEMSVILGFMILVSSALMALNVRIHHVLSRTNFHGPRALIDFAYHGLILTSTFVVTVSMFLVLFGRLPNRHMKLRQVLPSALLTALFWEAARSLFTLLMPVFNYRHVYGSIGAVVALMTWAYISSAVTLFGAQVSSALYGTLRVRVDGTSVAVPSPADIL